jgi:hypothetical protein
VAETSEKNRRNPGVSEKVDNFVYSKINGIIDGIKNAIKKVLRGSSNLIGKLFDKIEDQAYGTTNKKTIISPDNIPAETSKKPLEPNHSEENLQFKSFDKEKQFTLQEDKDFNKKLAQFISKFKPKAKKVVYLESGKNNVSKVLPDSELVYVDPQPENVIAHQNAGHTIVNKPITDFRPSELLDLLIISKPRLENEEAVALMEMINYCGYFVTKGNPAIINFIKSSPDFNVIGVVTDKGIVTKNFAPYLTQITGDEELKNLHPDYYNKAIQKMIEEKRPPTMQVVDYIRLKAEENDGTLDFDVPFQKGDINDLYIFRTISEKQKIDSAIPMKTPDYPAIGSSL